MNRSENCPKVVIQMSQQPRIFTRMIENLEKAFEQSPPRLVIEMVCAEPLLPDTALILHELLLARPHGLELITRARSGLINASVLPWLMGDIREMRHNGWMYINIPKPLMDKLIPAPKTSNDSLPWRDNDIFDFFPMDTHYMADWEQVLRLIEPYLPLEEVAGKRLSPENLRGLGVLSGNLIDAFLRSVQDPILKAPAARDTDRRPPGSRFLL